MYMERPHLGLSIFVSHSPCTLSLTRKIGCGSEIKEKPAGFLCIPLALHTFANAQDRLRLGNKRKTCGLSLYSTRLAHFR